MRITRYPNIEPEGKLTVKRQLGRDRDLIIHWCAYVRGRARFQGAWLIATWTYNGITGNYEFHASEVPFCLICVAGTNLVFEAVCAITRTPQSCLDERLAK
ncbi:MAG: hypothetical protein LAP85_29505 [Acidobacteriia bacterium]|nr:hypothetical protein [Terriglobia bacterium]